jgi:hypothetical protein
MIPLRFIFNFDGNTERDLLIGKAYASTAGLYTDGDNYRREQNIDERNGYTAQLIKKFASNDAAVAGLVVDLIPAVAKRNLEAGIDFAAFVATQTKYEMREQGRAMGLAGLPVTDGQRTLLDGAIDAWKGLINEGGEKFGQQWLKSRLEDTALITPVCTEIKVCALNALRGMPREVAPKPPSPYR